MKVGDLVQIAEQFKARSEDPEMIGIVVGENSVLKTSAEGLQKHVPYYRVMFKNDYVWLFRENIQPLNQKRTENVLDNIAG